MFAKLVDIYLADEEKEIYARFENLVSHDSLKNAQEENSDYIKKKIEKAK